MTKPNRFQRAIANVQCFEGGDVYTINSTAALTLLRKQHAAMLRLVRKQASYADGRQQIVYMSPQEAYRLACTEIEKKMKEYMQ